MSVIQQFFKEHGISEVEAIIPDMAGVPRGKIMPAAKFAEDEGMRLPESIFLQTVTGEYPDDDRAISPSEIDIVLKADPNTIRVVPWTAEPTAQVIHDSFYSDGRPVTMAPRYLLQHVLELYAQHGWEPVVAPELEFFLVEPNIDADYPLKPPMGRSGRPEIGRQAYSIAAVNEFDPLFDDIYAFCQRLRDAGVVINRPPRDGHMAFIRSPDGISVELLQRGAPLPPREPWKSMPNTGAW